FYLLFSEYPKLFWKLSGATKAHYLFAGTFYFNGLATFFTIILPVWFLFAGVFAVEFPLAEFAIHLAPYAISIVLIYAFIQRWYTHSSERRVPWRSMVLEKGTWHIYVLAMISSMLGRSVPYLPTPKDSPRAATPGLVLPHLVAISL